MAFASAEGEVLMSKLSEFRKARGLRQKEVADAVGISQSFLSDLERGAYDPSLRVARNLAAFYGVTVNDIVRPEGEGVSRNE